MATLTIRGLDDDIRDRLRLRAATHGRSMEAEARSILAEAVASPIERSLVDIMLAMRETLDGEGLELPERGDPVRDPFA
jgi:plasmid stability protein